MKKQSILILFSTLSVSSAFAQKNAFRIGIGRQITWIADKQASPLTYRSSEKTFLLHYNYTGNNGTLFAHIEGAVGKMLAANINKRWWYNQEFNRDGTAKKDSSLMMGILYNAHIAIGYLKAFSNNYLTQVENKNGSRNYYGGSLHNQLFYSDNIVRTGWMNTTSLNADYQRNISIQQKHYISVKISVPLFARNARLPYHNTISSATGESNIKTFFKNGSKWAWITNFQNVQVTAQYEYAINNRLGAGVYYYGQWLHYMYAKPVTIYQNNLSIFASVK